MRARAIRTAAQFDLLERCMEFEHGLLSIRDIVPDRWSDGIDFDISGWLSDIRQLIIVPKYSIPASAPDYFERRRSMIESIIELARQFGLTRTEDRIEDYGEHYYIVFRCDSTWNITEK